LSSWRTIVAKKRKKTDFTEQRERVREIREYAERERQRLRDLRIAAERRKAG
jgi:hypothetical protein